MKLYQPPDSECRYCLQFLQYIVLTITQLKSSLSLHFVLTFIINKPYNIAILYIKENFNEIQYHYPVMLCDNNCGLFLSINK